MHLISCLIIGLTGIFITACSLIGMAPDLKRGNVMNILERTEEMLKEEKLESIRHFFSENFYNGYDKLEQRITDKWNGEQLLDIQFSINRILERDHLLNVQVRWHKSYLDHIGRPQKSSGLSEITLVPYQNTYKIIKITGTHFF